jgi:hypothetical protein
MRPAPALRCQRPDRLAPETLADAFQVGPANPLVGLDGRLALLQRLGAVMAATPAVFGTPARAGRLVDYLHAHATAGSGGVLHPRNPAARPGPRVARPPEPEGCPGRLLGPPGPEDGLLPFHKLTQWLTYSLLEPLEAAGLSITGLDELTGLPEYRNGGLLLDFGLIQPRDAASTHPGRWTRRPSSNGGRSP